MLNLGDIVVLKENRSHSRGAGIVLLGNMVPCRHHHTLHCVAPCAFSSAFLHITSFENGELRFHQMSLGTFCVAVVCCPWWEVYPEGRTVMLELRKSHRSLFPQRKQAKAKGRWHS